MSQVGPRGRSRADEAYNATVMSSTSARSDSARPAPTPPQWPAWSAPRASAARGGRVAAELDRIGETVLAGERITASEALFLHEEADLLTLGRLADHVRQRLHPEPVVTYIVDRNLNPTNVCITDCGFCAFYRRPQADGAYVLERDEIHRRVQETAELGGRQLLMQGGHHPYLKTAWWCDLIADLRARWPAINAHALSAPELDHLAKLDKRPVADVIADLVDAGLGSVPGAGAEVLVERVRAIIAPKKTSTDRWLAVHRDVHEAGLRSSATLMYGHVETAAERIEHLARLRDLQDETGGFTAFACWNMQREGVPEEWKYPPRTTRAVYLRVVALARIFLDNFASVQTSYVTQGMKVAQLSLRFGCNDFGGTMLEENVVSAAGCFHLQSVQAIERQVRRAGFTPLQRNSWYGVEDERAAAVLGPAPRVTPLGTPCWGPRSRAEAATHPAARGSRFAEVAR